MAAKKQQQKQQSTAIARITDQDVNDFLKERKAALSGYAIRKYKMDSFLRSAFIAITENYRLADAMKTRRGQGSLYHALKHASNTGLSLNPQENKACLVPRYDKKSQCTIVTYQIMKDPLIDLIMETGQVEDIITDLVRENDVFEMELTADNDSYVFKPARKNRGEIDGYFAAMKLKNGRVHLAWMTKGEAEEHRDRYNASKSLEEKSPWVHSFDGMAIKTVIKKLLRNLHLSDETTNAVITDDVSEIGVMDVIDMAQDEPEPEAPAQKGASPEDVEKELEQDAGDDEPPPDGTSEAESTVQQPDDII